MKRARLLLGLFICLTLLPSCRKFDDVKNLNNPDAVTVYNSPEDLYTLAGTLANQWFQATQAYFGPAGLMWVGADWGTCSWGQWNDFSTEPRKSWNNNPLYAYSLYSSRLYENLYYTLTDANRILNEIVIEGVVLEEESDNKMVEAIARLVQGLSLGYIGLIYDQGFIVDETTELQEAISSSGYRELISSSIEYLDKCIEICNEHSFTLPSEWIPGDVWTNKEIGQLANSMAARIMIGGSRTKKENNENNWSSIRSYAENGIDFDFAPLADDIAWYSLYHTYSIYPGWGRVDMRVIHMLDSIMPDYFPSNCSFNDLPNNGLATSDDSRLKSDFEYLSTCPFRPERGCYHFSSYRYSRLDKYLETWTEPMPEMYMAENDLMLAESELMLGNKESAIDILNNGTRISRGNLQPISYSATKDEVEEAIMYERTIELFLSSCGLPFFDMRRKDMLQEGTPLHFPIPGDQLELMMIPNYTFGGVDNADGINTSDGGWNKP